GVVRAASACRYCARLISVPSGVTAALLLMFCALKGATHIPRLARCLQRAVTRNDLPASLEQPMIMMGCATILAPRQSALYTLQVYWQWLLPEPVDLEPEAGNGLAVESPRGVWHNQIGIGLGLRQAVLVQAAPLLVHSPVFRYIVGAIAAGFRP